jgi:glycosyltransferase involved in cell wall biosynthesis
MRNEQNNNIVFSVIICCYNSEKYLVETIESVISQTFIKWELVIINDGSTDKTKDIISKYKQEGLPIIYHEQPNSGYARSRNKALEIMNGEWAVFLDHDDICYKNRLEEQFKDIKNNPNCNLFFSNADYITEDNIIFDNHYNFIHNPNELTLKNKVAKQLVSKGCFIGSSTVVINKNHFLIFGGLNESLKYVADFDFFIRFGHNFNFFANKKSLAKIRVFSGSLGHKKSENRLEESGIYLRLIFSDTSISKLLLFYKFMLNLTKSFAHKLLSLKLKYSRIE